MSKNWLEERREYRELRADRGELEEMNRLRRYGWRAAKPAPEAKKNGASEKPACRLQDCDAGRGDQVIVPERNRALD